MDKDILVFPGVGVNDGMRLGIARFADGDKAELESETPAAGRLGPGVSIGIMDERGREVRVVEVKSVEWEAEDRE